MEEALIRAGLTKGRYRIEPSQGWNNDKLIINSHNQIVARAHEAMLNSDWIIDLC